MSTKEQKEIFEYQTNLAREAGVKEKGLESRSQYPTYMIKDRTTPQLRKKFLEEIKKTKETGKERGFHLCIEKDGKLSAGDTCTGDECSLLFRQPSLSCPERNVQGEFHTHPYLTQVRKLFNITFKGASDKLISASVESYLKEIGHTPTMPSHTDTTDAILGKCAKKMEGTTCIGTDLDINKVECWTTKNIDDGDCIRALMEKVSPREEDYSTLPHEWEKPLFNIEIIDLKSIRRKITDKR